MRPNQLMDLKYLQVAGGTADLTTLPINGVGYNQVVFLLTGQNNNDTACKIYAYAYDVLAGTHKQAIGYWLRTNTDTTPDVVSAWVRYEAGSEATVDTTAATDINFVVAVDLAEAVDVNSAAGYPCAGVGLITADTGAWTNLTISAVMQPVRAKDTQAVGLLA